MKNKITELLNKNVTQDDHGNYILNAYPSDVENLVNELLEAINDTRCCTELPTKEEVYSEIKRLTDLYYNDDNARKSAFGLGVSIGVNLVNKKILK